MPWAFAASAAVKMDRVFQSVSTTSWRTLRATLGEDDERDVEARRLAGEVQRALQLMATGGPWSREGAARGATAQLAALVGWSLRDGPDFGACELGFGLLGDCCASGAQLSWGRTSGAALLECTAAIADYLVEGADDEELADPATLTRQVQTLNTEIWDVEYFANVYLRRLLLQLSYVSADVAAAVARLPACLRPAAWLAAVSLGFLGAKLSWRMAAARCRATESVREVRLATLHLAHDALAYRGAGGAWRELSGMERCRSEYLARNEASVDEAESCGLLVGNAGRSLAVAFGAAAAFVEDRGAVEDFARLLSRCASRLVPLMDLSAQVASSAPFAASFLEWLQRRRAPSPEPSLSVGGGALLFDAAEKSREGHALSIDRLEVPRGAHVCVTGPSGSGKTALLAMARGSVKPDAGRVLLGGRDLAELSARQRGQIFYCLDQNSSACFLAGTVREALLCRRGEDGGSREDQEPRALMAALEDVGLARVGLEEPAVRLSGGERQRLACARALLDAEGRVLLADEPFSALDRDSELELLKVLRRRAGTLLLVTHSDAAPQLFEWVLQVRVDESRRASASWLRTPAP